MDFEIIEYIETDIEYNGIAMVTVKTYDKLLDILKGSDKDILGFEGTLKELDNLSIRGNNE